jgi:hypothetical protein
VANSNRRPRLPRQAHPTAAIYPLEARGGRAVAPTTGDNSCARIAETYHSESPRSRAHPPRRIARKDQPGYQDRSNQPLSCFCSESCRKQAVLRPLPCIAWTSPQSHSALRGNGERGSAGLCGTRLRGALRPRLGGDRTG